MVPRCAFFPTTCISQRQEMGRIKRRSMCLLIIICAVFILYIYHLSTLASINYHTTILKTTQRLGDCCVPNRKNKVVSPFSSTCGYNCERFGTVYGGRSLPKTICGLQQHLTIFSFGCGEDISFDVAMAATFNARIYMFDPTPRASVHVHSVFKALEKKEIPRKARLADKYIAIDGKEHEISAGYSAVKWFHNVVSSSADLNQLHFSAVALGDIDGNMTFVEPKVGVSHFLSDSGETSKGKGHITVPVYTMQTLMHMTDTNIIDIVKLNIEGFEVKVIPQLLKLFKTWPKKRWPKVLLFNMDCMLKGHPKQDMAAGRRMVKMITESGYSIFVGSEKQPDYTFVLNYRDTDCANEKPTYDTQVLQTK